jgi:tetratricopeptide (TPR) repeat protein
LRFLAYLVKRLDGLPISLAVTLRPDEPGAAGALIGEVVHDPLVVTLRPAPLSEATTAEVLRMRLSAEPDAAFSAATFRATGGNPLLLHELVAMMAAEGVRPRSSQAGVLDDVGPRAVSRTVVVRLARLPPAATAAARALAVLGDAAELPVLAALARLPELVAAEALRALAQAEIVRREPPAAFVHRLVRDAVYRDLPPGERELAHARAAQLLKDAGAPPEQVAAQLVASPRRGDPAVVEALADAARRAAAQGAPDSAVAYLRRALEEPPVPARRATLLLELGSAEAQVSMPDAVGRLREALDGVDAPALRAAAAEGLARMLIFGGDPDGAVAVADRAQRELAGGDDDLWCRFEALSLMARPFGAELGDAPERFVRARERPLAPGDGARMLAITAAWDWACSGGTAEDCARLVLDALDDGAIIAHDPGLLAVLAAATLLYADRPEVMSVLDDAQAQAHRSGSLFVALGVEMWRGHALLLRGELEDAEATLNGAQERFEAFGIAETNAGAYTKSNIVRVLVEQGRLEEARRVQDRPIALISGSDGDAIARRAEIELLLAEDRPQEALEAADALRAGLRRISNPAAAPWRTLRALALDRLGQPQEALEAALEELAVARQFGAPGTVGRALRIVGTLEREAGLAHLEEAVGVLEASTARLELAKALLAQGGALRRGRRPTDAREPLRRALVLAQ